jgi:hypothetical protein
MHMRLAGGWWCAAAPGPISLWAAGKGPTTGEDEESETDEK